MTKEILLSLKGLQLTSDDEGQELETIITGRMEAITFCTMR